MGLWRGKTLEEQHTIWEFGVVAILAASGGLAYLVAQTPLGLQGSVFVAGGGAVALVVFAYFLFYEEAATEHWIGNDGDYKLTRKERVSSAVRGTAFMALAYAVEWVGGAFGVEESLATLLVWIPGMVGLAYLWRALWGVDQNDTDGLD